MINIYKVSYGSPVDYAAEELRKYLKMMMPDEGSFKVIYNEVDKSQTEYDSVKFL